MFGNRKYKSVINKLTELGKRYVLGISSTKDKIQWVSNLTTLEESNIKINSPVYNHDNLLYSFKDIYNDYLIKHFCDDMVKGSKNGKQYIKKRNNLYRNMLFSLICEAYYLIDDKNLKVEIESYFYSFNRNVFSLSEIGEKAKEEELLNLANRIKDHINYKTEFEKEWHIRIDNISSFKFGK
ncbi:hypothetical protein FDC45_11245 [Clostridium botulinum]|uniref:Uncharacterized protein n=1 Tax=Clostridium botulinum TaxID=1491 RepID=A0A846J7M5_CLOBO|nr:hypothetical protein [Clostridium botulinum]ACA57567.1 hypothetical protein CLK_A0089 [Clostridium botulinum A3 str. Loch Maree]NFH65074.1 hypothetical protein [Clostridium botulinum]NFJ09472.1 hypothetical protein [Clostridium botulinum]NFK16706.1 hypothetical protein [Clostridium botulinum]NFM93581.1 hypothetical protein [Clostridium botulinum]